MAFSWFILKSIGPDGKEVVNPLYSGYERLSADGTQFILHDEIAIESGAKLAKTSILPTKAVLGAKVASKTIVMNEAICTKDIMETKTLLATVEWAPKEVVVEEKPVDSKPIKEVVVNK